MVLCAGCSIGCLDDAAMNYFRLFLLLPLFTISGFSEATWIADRDYLNCKFNEPCDPRAVCQEPNFLYLYDREASPLICFTTNYYIKVGFNLEQPCPSGIDPETFQCAGQTSCLDAKPVTSSTNAQTACFNQCSYTSLGGFRDYDNALAPIAYEYIPTGGACTGNEETAQLAGVSEYTEINEDELPCRSDGNTQVCISADKTCKLVNGVPVCIDNQTREDQFNCGTFNGEVVCFEKDAYSNCQYVNGEYLCVYPEGNKVDPDSVDHPANGGNANGKTNDDILDQQDLAENTQEAQSVKQIVRETGIRQQAEKQAESNNPKSAFSGLGCDKEVTCTGDAIQCAIARMQKKQLCLSEFNDSEISSIISSHSDMSPLGSLPGDTLEIHVDDFLETDEYVTSDNQCPEPIGFSVLGAEYEIVLTPLCDLASYISWFILFATWFSMSVVLAKSLGNG
ncbi:virulence factor TspB C-terminal domain-related protein [Endozoicomonas sp. ALC013]